jgi:hypothetical protein
MKSFLRLSLFLPLVLAAPFPAVAKTKQSASVTVPVSPPFIQAPISPSQPAAPSTVAAIPARAPVPMAFVPAPKQAEQATPVEVIAGDLIVRDARAVFKDAHIDLFFSVENRSKDDERLGGGDTPMKNSGVVEIVTGVDGKPQEKSIVEPLPGGKKVVFSEHEGKWLRIKSAQSEPKPGDLVTFTLYFRRSPNATLRVGFDAIDGTVQDNMGSGMVARPWYKRLLDWFRN